MSTNETHSGLLLPLASIRALLYETAPTPGIWFEPARRRWRVRIYHGTRIIHRSYHRRYVEALAAHRKALAGRQQPAQPATLRPFTAPISEYLRNLINDNSHNYR